MSTNAQNIGSVAAEGRVLLTEHYGPARSDECVMVQTLDAPGNGGAHHRYLLQWSPVGGALSPSYMVIEFQNGPIPQVGPNGVTHEALLAIVAHRLECFNQGPFACRENAVALTKIQEALMWLHRRTQKRIERNVEGTNYV